ncbi:unnamed protein product [Pedinophyceae sp. YPF-701]|nr:unnamed protein product [Pedinophyceae sp. YPF-701]
MAETGENWFLIIVTIVVTCLCLLSNIYLLAHYQHPDDKLDGWGSKVIVVLALTSAALTVLMFPLDVGNRQACDDSLEISACNFSMPMRELWYFMWCFIAILAFVVIPFALFFYESDTAASFYSRCLSALFYETGLLVILGLCILLPYGIVGFMEFDVQSVTSGLVSLDRALTHSNSSGDACIFPTVDDTDPAASAAAGQFGGDLCDGLTGDTVSAKWKMRATFPVFLVGVASIIGWILFSIFGAVGVVTLPWDWVRGFLNRPRKVITKSDYIHRCRHIAQRSRDVQDAAKRLKDQERAGGRGRKWRREVQRLGAQLLEIEEEEQWLLEAYPQGEDPAAKWTIIVVFHWARLVGGCVGALWSVFWLLHIILYVLVKPAAHPFLNDLFTGLDDAFPLFGTAAFGFFCLYMVMVTMHGMFKMGLWIGFMTIHPMRAHNTFMGSFLFNCVLVLLTVVAITQFCARAFAVYAEGTEVHTMFETDVKHLIGFKPLYDGDVFMYVFVVVVFLSLCYQSCTGCRQKPQKKARINLNDRV